MSIIMEYETSIYFFVKNLHLFFVENVFNFLRPNCTSDNTTEEESDAAKEARFQRCFTMASASPMFAPTSPLGAS